MIKIKAYGAAILEYLGDAAHRRFVASMVALALTHIVGHAIAGETVATNLDLIVGGFAGAWSRTTPKIDPIMVPSDG